MNIHEYQGKEILKRYGVKVPEGRVAFSVEEAEAAPRTRHVRRRKSADPCRRTGQSGRRQNREEVWTKCATMQPSCSAKCSSRIRQVRKAKKCKRLLIEQGCDIKKEYYLGVVVDRGNGPRRHDGFRGRRHGDRRSGRPDAGENFQRSDRSGCRLAAVPGAQAGLCDQHSERAGQQGGPSSCWRCTTRSSTRTARSPRSIRSSSPATATSWRSTPS